MRVAGSSSSPGHVASWARSSSPRWTRRTTTAAWASCAPWSSSGPWAMLGVTEWENLGYRDSDMMGRAGNLDPRSFWRADLDEAAGRLVWLIRRYKPDVMTTYNEYGGYGHPDHIRTHDVAIRAFPRAGDPAGIRSSSHPSTAGRARPRPTAASRRGSRRSSTSRRIPASFARRCASDWRRWASRTSGRRPRTPRRSSWPSSGAERRRCSSRTRRSPTWIDISGDRSTQVGGDPASTSRRSATEPVRARSASTGGASSGARRRTSSASRGWRPRARDGPVRRARCPRHPARGQLQPAMKGRPGARRALMRHRSPGRRMARLGRFERQTRPLSRG